MKCPAPAELGRRAPGRQSCENQYATRGTQCAAERQGPRRSEGPGLRLTIDPSQGLPLRRLSFQEERLWELAFAARDPRLESGVRRLDRTDVGEESVEDQSIGSSASAAESHSRQLFLQAFPLGRIGRLGESTDERKKPFLLGFFGLQASLDQVDEHAIRARLPGLS